MHFHKRIKLILIFFVVTLLSTLAYGDDSAFMGDGANVYPIKHSEIQMVSETISLRFDDEKLQWLVDVTMNFHNHGSAESVQMGFPFKDPSGADIDKIDDESNLKLEEAPAYEFKSYVNGKEVKTTTKKGIINHKLPEHLFEKVMTFTVHFDAAEDKVVRHTYYIDGEVHGDGYRSISYILRTGALWRDVIKDCLITVEMPTRIAEMIYIVSPNEHRVKINGDLLKLYWRFKDIKPDFDIRLESLPGMITAFKTDELMNYMKSNGLYLESNYIRYFRNRVYARYGYDFKNPYVKAQFTGSPGQDGKTKFKPEMMSLEDKEFLQFLDLIEHKSAPK